MSSVCPPPARDSRFDMRNAASCAEKLRMILDAYESAISGSHRTIVRFQERWTEYQKSNAEQLMAYYNTMYAQCPEASRSGLPNLNPGLRAQRGGPARNFPRFGRL